MQALNILTLVSIRPLITPHHKRISLPLVKEEDIGLNHIQGYQGLRGLFSLMVSLICDEANSRKLT